MHVDFAVMVGNGDCSIRRDGGQYGEAGFGVHSARGVSRTKVGGGTGEPRPEREF